MYVFKAGLEDEVMKLAIAMPSRFIHLQDGSNAVQAYGKSSQVEGSS
jgi:hypothetical protein